MASTSGDPNYEESRLYSIATLMTKDNDFAIFRAFRELNFFNILHLQQSLAASEKKFHKALQQKLDVGEIIVEIRQLLKEYSEQLHYHPEYFMLICS